MKKRFISAITACLAFTMILSSCKADSGGGSGDNADKIVIGGLAPLTGNLSVYGIATNNGIKLAIEEINAAGGVLGKEINHIVQDEQGDTTEAINAFNKLVENDKIVALIGDVTSKPSIAVAQRAVEKKIPMITPTGTALEITAVGENIFRTCFTDPYQGEVMANYAAKKLDVKTAAILYDNSDDYSIGLMESFKATAKDLGIDIVSEESYTSGDINFTAQLTSIASKNADALFIPVYYEDVASIVVQAKTAGISSKLLGADGWDGVLSKTDESNLDALKDVYFSNHYSAENQDEKLQNFLSAYKEKYKTDANSFAALGYDSAYLLKAAIEKAGTTDYEALVKAINESKYEGVTGVIEYDENRNPQKQIDITTIADGNYKFVESFGLN